MKDNIALQGFIFTSNGFLVCCSIVILFIIKVLCIVMFKGFKGVGVCGVVCGDNSKVVRCVGVCGVVCRVVVVLWITYSLIIVLWIECG